MATKETIRRWDHILGEVQKTRKASPFIDLPVPGYPQFHQGFQLTVDVITKAFRDAWQSERPAEGSLLYAVLEPVAEAVDDWDFDQPADPQVEKFMGVVGEARRGLAEDDIAEATAEELVADLENLLKVSVLVARLGHRGALEIADTERKGRYTSANKATDRPATYLDLNTMFWVDRPSKTTLALSVFLMMVETPNADFRESTRCAGRGGSAGDHEAVRRAMGDSRLYRMGVRRSIPGRSGEPSTAAIEYRIMARKAIAACTRLGRNGERRSYRNCCAHPMASGRPASLRVASGRGETKTAIAPATRGNSGKPARSRRRSSRE
jgi:hypothetical protein